MILIGIEESVDSHSKIEYLETINDLELIPANVLAVVDFRKEDLQIYKEDTLLAVKITSLLEFILIMQTNAKYAVCDKNIAGKIQKCADGYLADIKVISLIDNVDEVEYQAEQEIDGVIGSWNLTKRFSQKVVHTT